VCRRPWGQFRSALRSQCPEYGWIRIRRIRDQRSAYSVTRLSCGMLPVGRYTGLQGASHLLPATCRLLQAFRRARLEAELVHRIVGVPACMANALSGCCSETKNLHGRPRPEGPGGCCRKSDGGANPCLVVLKVHPSPPPLPLHPPRSTCLHALLALTPDADAASAARAQVSAPAAAVLRGGLAGGCDNFIIRTLRAAIRPPAPIAGCRAAVRGGARWLRQLHHPHSEGRRPASGTDRRVSGGGAWEARQPWLPSTPGRPGSPPPSAAAAAAAAAAVVRRPRKHWRPSRWRLTFSREGQILVPGRLKGRPRAPGSRPGALGLS
jgi:hypothetical protein